MPEAEQHRFYAWADDVGRVHGHVLEAPSFEAAAVGYVELYAPPVTGDEDLRVFVTDLEGGGEHCFTIDFGDGRVEACD
jgi:hypothetical protein